MDGPGTFIPNPNLQRQLTESHSFIPNPNLEKQLKHHESPIPAAPKDYTSYIDAATQKYNLPPGLLQAQLFRESSYDPKAVSSAGAEGIAQFMPGTAREMHIDPLNPKQAIDGEGKYMSELYHQTGSWDKALAAYNGALGRNGKVSEAGQEYVDSIMPFVQFPDKQGKKLGRTLTDSKHVANLRHTVARLRKQDHEAQYTSLLGRIGSTVGSALGPVENFFRAANQRARNTPPLEAGLMPTPNVERTAKSVLGAIANVGNLATYGMVDESLKAAASGGLPAQDKQVALSIIRNPTLNPLQKIDQLAGVFGFNSMDAIHYWARDMNLQQMLIYTAGQPDSEALRTLLLIHQDMAQFKEAQPWSIGPESFVASLLNPVYRLAPGAGTVSKVVRGIGTRARIGAKALDDAARASKATDAVDRAAKSLVKRAISRKVFREQVPHSVAKLLSWAGGALDSSYMRNVGTTKSFLYPLDRFSRTQIAYGLKAANEHAAAVGEAAKVAHMAKQLVTDPAYFGRMTLQDRQELPKYVEQGVPPNPENPDPFTRLSSRSKQSASKIGERATNILNLSQHVDEVLRKSLPRFAQHHLIEPKKGPGVTHEAAAQHFPRGGLRSAGSAIDFLHLKGGPDERMMDTIAQGEFGDKEYNQVYGSANISPEESQEFFKNNPNAAGGRVSGGKMSPIWEPAVAYARAYITKQNLSRLARDFKVASGWLDSEGRKAILPITYLWKGSKAWAGVLIKDPLTGEETTLDHDIFLGEGGTGFDKARTFSKLLRHAVSERRVASERGGELERSFRAKIPLARAAAQKKIAALNKKIASAKTDAQREQLAEKLKEFSPEKIEERLRGKLTEHAVHQELGFSEKSLMNHLTADFRAKNPTHQLDAGQMFNVEDFNGYAMQPQAAEAIGDANPLFFARHVRPRQAQSSSLSHYIQQAQQASRIVRSTLDRPWGFGGGADGAYTPQESGEMNDVAQEALDASASPWHTLDIVNSAIRTAHLFGFWYHPLFNVLPNAVRLIVDSAGADPTKLAYGFGMLAKGAFLTSGHLLDDLVISAAKRVHPRFGEEIEKKLPSADVPEAWLKDIEHSGLIHHLGFGIPESLNDLVYLFSANEKDLSPLRRAGKWFHRSLVGAQQWNQHLTFDIGEARTLATTFHILQKFGVPREKAIRLIRRDINDYNNLSDFEQGIALNRWMYFYRWMRMQMIAATAHAGDIRVPAGINNAIQTSNAAQGLGQLPNTVIGWKDQQGNTHMMSPSVGVYKWTNDALNVLGGAGLAVIGGPKSTKSLEHQYGMMLASNLTLPASFGLRGAITAAEATGVGKGETPTGGALSPLTDVQKPFGAQLKQFAQQLGEYALPFNFPNIGVPTQWTDTLNNQQFGQASFYIDRLRSMVKSNKWTTPQRQKILDVVTRLEQGDPTALPQAKMLLVLYGNRRQSTDSLGVKSLVPKSALNLLKLP